MPGRRRPGQKSLAGTVTGKDQLPRPQPLEFVPVHGAPVALAEAAGAGPVPGRQSQIRLQSQPVEIVQDLPLVFRAAALAVVILDPQDDRPAKRARQPQT